MLNKQNQMVGLTLDTYRKVMEEIKCLQVTSRMTQADIRRFAAGHDSGHVRVIEVTESSPFGGSNTSSPYWGKIELLNDRGEWETEEEFVKIRAYDEEEELENGEKYIAFRAGLFRLGVEPEEGEEDTRPVYVVYVKIAALTDMDGDGEPSQGDCIGCGWLLEPSISCLKLTIKDKYGNCLCIDDEQEFGLYSFGGGVFIGGTFATCCGCSSVEFSVFRDTDRPEVYGKLRLMKRNRECGEDQAPYTQEEYKLWNARCCDNKSVEFDIAEDENCNGAIAGECGNHAVVRVECFDECPIPSCCCPGCEAGCETCLCIPAGPAAWYLDLSAAMFTGEASLFNIQWVLVPCEGGVIEFPPPPPTEASCKWCVECKVPDPNAPGEFIMELYIDFEWIGAGGVGWRLTLSGSAGTIIYETLNVQQDCCAPIVLNRVQGESGPLTVTVSPLGVTEDDCDCAPPLEARTFHYVISISNNECPCLQGLEGDLTYDPVNMDYRHNRGADPCACTDHGSPPGNMIVIMETNCTSILIECGACATGAGIVSTEKCPIVLTFQGGEETHEGGCCPVEGVATYVVTIVVTENEAEELTYQNMSMELEQLTPIDDEYLKDCKHLGTLVSRCRTCSSGKSDKYDCGIYGNVKLKKCSTCPDHTERRTDTISLPLV